MTDIKLDGSLHSISDPVYGSIYQSFNTHRSTDTFKYLVTQDLQLIDLEVTPAELYNSALVFSAGFQSKRDAQRYIEWRTTDELFNRTSRR